MKRFYYILLIIFCTNSTFAQKYKLIEVIHTSDYTKDCRKTGNCLSSKYIKNGKLYITIYVNNQYRVLESDGYSFEFFKDILNIEIFNANSRKTKDTIINGKRMILGIASISYRGSFGDSYDTQKYIFTFTGFGKVPKVVKLNHIKL